MSDKRPFSQIFELTPPAALSQEPWVRKVRLSKARRTMDVELVDSGGALTARWLDWARAALLAKYGLSVVTLSVDAPAPVPLPAPASPSAPRAPRPGASAVPGASGAPLPASHKTMLFGKPFTAKPVPMGDVVFEERRTAVAGRVVELETRELANGTKLLIQADLGDATGAVRAKLLFQADTLAQGKALAKKLEASYKAGDTLEVSGKLQLDTYKDTSEWVLRPSAIRAVPRPKRQDAAPHKRVELHLHTQMSQRDALTDVGEAIRQAAEWGHAAIAITDHGVCHSFPDAMKAAQKAGIRVLYGMEGYVPPEEAEGEASGGNWKRNRHIILLAQNETGLRNLYRLVSKSHTEHFKRRPLIPRPLLEAHREGLIVGSACEAGDLFRAVVEGRPAEELERIARFYDYLEIQPVVNNRFMVLEGIAPDDDALRDYNRVIVALGERLSIPVCATGDVHFLDKGDELYRRVLLAGTKMNRDEPLPLYFRTTDEMLEEFSYLGAEKAFEVVVTNPNAIAARCGDIAPVREGEYSPVAEGSAELLTALCYDKVRALYGPEPPAFLLARIEQELGPIIQKGYDTIFVIAQKIVQRSLDQGYYVGSRGSVGSSIVAYLAGITEVNALPPHYLCTHPDCQHHEFPGEDARCGATCGVDLPDKACPRCGAKLQKDGFDLVFATFMGFYADKTPDIDLNFSDEYQERAHAHAVELLGGDHVFRAGTISTLQTNNARGYAKKYLEELGQPDDNPAEVSRLAFGCVGVKDTTGQHPGGLVIVPRGYDITDFCPVHYPANDKTKMVTTHFVYEAIEDNLLKLDLLGHKDPTMIRALEDMTGVRVTDIPLDDPDTMSLFTSSKALGYEKDPLLGESGAVAVPEFGTQFVRGMLKTTRPKCFEELLRISGLSHGTDVWRGNQEELVTRGTATLREIICSREDIMLYLIARGIDNKTAFTITESVRRGKGLTPEWEDAMRRANIPAWYIESCRRIQYMFPKAHAVAYVLMAFRVAWFKVHRPLQFYRAYFTKRAKHFEAPLMTSGIEAVKRRLKGGRGSGGEGGGGGEDKNKDKEQLVTLEVVYEF
ncbi:MAG: PolC-type DNA polymerase III, partial [Oscillospiraceae bacterium]|nr:PolC-type DNA polymerase III [Oscillospiraceae bacterium]